MSIEIDSEIYTRSAPLNLRIPHSVTIIGVGGIGGWVSFLFPLVGVSELILVDPDILEVSNLNRLPYKQDQVGMHKVHAMAELIGERRNCTVQQYPMRWENIPADERQKLISEYSSESSIIIDCRDSVTPLPDITETYINAGYDGTSLTLHAFPKMENVWSEGPVTYNVTPSYVVAANLAALEIINFICREIHVHSDLHEQECILTFNLDDLFKILQRGLAAPPAPKKKSKKASGDS